MVKMIKSKTCGLTTPGLIVVVVERTPIKNMSNMYVHYDRGNTNGGWKGVKYYNGHDFCLNNVSSIMICFSSRKSRHAIMSDMFSELRVTTKHNDDMKRTQYPVATHGHSTSVSIK